MRPSGIGGQAVIEGVMMKNKDIYATAVRKPDHEIIIEKNTYVSKSEKYKIFKFPIFRGMLAFAESMIIGTKTLTFSSSFYEEEEVKPSKVESAFSKLFKDKAESIAMGITMFLSVVLAVGIFIVLPRFMATLLEKTLNSDIWLAVVEGIIRILIFIAYVVAISQMKDIKRLFMYHGAEHKTINCIEHGLELTVENVKKQSKQHKRCGTSFIFIVMFVSIIFFIFIRVDQEWLRYLIRILLIPIIAGVSYEFIRFAGKYDNVIANVLSQPGLWMQGLTTKEPDEDMIEVAIKSVEAVFDWRKFLEEDGKSFRNRNARKKNNGKGSTGKGNTDKGNTNKGNTGRSNTDKSSRNNGGSRDLKDREEITKSGEDADKIRSVASVSENERQEYVITEESSASKKQQGGASHKRSNSKQNKREETTAASREPLGGKKRTILDEEEEDEILRALDRYLVDKEEEERTE